jgi:hypothetical protein
MASSVFLFTISRGGQMAPRVIKSFCTKRPEKEEAFTNPRERTDSPNEDCPMMEEYI